MQTQPPADTGSGIANASVATPGSRTRSSARTASPFSATPTAGAGARSREGGACTAAAPALRLNKGQATSASLSLARTAALLIGTPRQEIEPKALSPADADYSAAIEATDWGSAHRALPPVRVAGAPMGWTCPALRLGSASAAWG